MVASIFLNYIILVGNVVDLDSWKEGFFEIQVETAWDADIEFPDVPMIDSKKLERLVDRCIEEQNRRNSNKDPNVPPTPMTLKVTADTTMATLKEMIWTNHPRFFVM